MDPAHSPEGAAAVLPPTGVVPETASEPLYDGTEPTTMAEWVSLGREVFFRFPLRADVWVQHGLASSERAARFGIETAPDGSAPGAVLFRDLDGRDRVGISCAICHTTRDGDAVVVPAGTYHNVINVSDEPLKLYTIYSPPNHPDGTVHKTKAEAEAAEHHR